MQSFDEWSNEQKRKKQVNDNGSLSFDEWSNRQKARSIEEKVTAPILYPSKETLRAAENADPTVAVEMPFGNAISRRTHAADATQRIRQASGAEQDIEQMKKSYYSMPELGKDKRWENQLIDAEKAVTNAKKTYETALQRESDGRSAIDQASTALKELQAQYEKNPSNLNALLLQNRTGNFYKLLSKYSDSYKDALTYYDAYTKAYDRLLEANEAFGMYQSDQQKQYDAWKETVRPEAVVRTNIEEIRKEIKDGEADLNDLKIKRAQTSNSMYDAPIAEQRKRLSDLEAEKKKAEEELSWAHYFSFDSLREAEDFAELSQYIKEPIAEDPNVEPSWWGGWSNPLYEAINGNEEAAAYLSSAATQKWAKTAGDDGGLATILAGIYGESKEGRGEIPAATEEQKALFNYYYHKYGKEAAEKFYEERLRDDILLQQRADNQKEWSDFATKNAGNAIAATVGTIAESPLKGISYVLQLADYLGTGKIDENATYNDFSRWNTTARNAIMEQMNNSGSWGKAGSFLYGVGTSIADFAWQTLLAGGFSSGYSTAAKKISESIALGLMGTGAAADATIEAKDRGLDDRQAFALGTIAGAAEIMTEKFSIETLLDGVGNGRAWKYIAKNAFTEGSEEVSSDVINFVADVLISKDKSQWKEAIRAYEADGKNEKQAFLAAVRDQALSMGESFLGGFLSGGIMSSIGGASAAYSEKQLEGIGKQLNRPGVDEENIRISLLFPEESDIRMLGEEYAQKLKEGKSLSNLERGRLFAALQQAAAPDADFSARGLRDMKNDLKAQQRAEQTEIKSEADATIQQETVNGTQAADGNTDTVLADNTAQQSAAAGQTLREQTGGRNLMLNQETATLMPETEARLANAETELERSGILAGAGDEAIQTAQTLSRVLGREILFFNRPGNDAGTHDGFFDRTDGRIYLNAASQNPVAQIISHELTHTLEGSSSYRALHNLVLQEIGKGGSLDRLRQEKAAFYAQNGVDISTQVTQNGYSAVDAELVAEYVAKNLLTDAGIIQRVVRQNRTLGQRIWQFINDLLGKLGFRNAKERAFLLRARSLYSAALQETQSSFRNDLQMRYNRMEADIAELFRRVEAGEISEEDARAAYDEIYDPEADMAHGPGNDILQNSYVGKDANGIEIYETSEAVKNLPRKEKMQLFLQLMTDEYRGRTAKFTDGNGVVHYAIFDKDDTKKNIYGDKRSSARGWYAKINTGADGSIFELVENATYSGAKKESGKQTKTHKDVLGWDYYVKTVQIDGVFYRVFANVRKKPNGEFVYSIQLNESKEGRKKVPAPPLDSDQQKTADKSGPTNEKTQSGTDWAFTDTTDSIAQMSESVNREIQESKKWTTQYSISPNLENELLEVLKDTFEKRRNEVYIGTTSNFLTKLLGVDSIPVTMPPRKAYAAMVSEARARADIRFHRDLNYHELGLNGLMRALEASENPVAVFAARSDGKEKRANSLVLVTNETMRGKNIVVVEAIETKGRLNEKQIEANKVVTAYDRGAVMADLMEAYADNRLLYLDKKRSQEILAGRNASNSRTTIQRINTDFTDSIANFLANVKWEKQENKKISFETPTATKTPMQLAMEKAQRRAAEKERQHSYSPKTTEEKRDIVGAFRQFLNGEIDKAALREKIGTDKIGTALDTNIWTGQREYLPSGTDTMAERVVRDAHKEGISVDEYLRQNAEHYTDENGEYNKIAMTAIALERKEAWRQWSLSGEPMDAETDTETTANAAADAAAEESSSYRSTLPTKARDYLRRAENRLRNRLGEALHLSENVQREELQSAVQAIGDEYFEQGRLVPETADRLFEQAWAEHAEPDAKQTAEEARLYKQAAKIDFDAAIADMLPELWRVKRYADERAQTAESAAQSPITYEEAVQAYKNLKEARRKSDRAKAKTVLTDHDRIQLGRLLRGEIELEHLDQKTDDVRGITTVYEASKEYESIAASLKKYKQQLREKMRAEADEYLKTSGSWREKKNGLAYARETMERNIEDTVPNRELAKEINRHYFEAVHKAEADSTRFKTQYRNRVRDLQISRKVEKGNIVSEAYAVQLLGEAQSNIEYLSASRHAGTAMRDGKTAEQWRSTIAALKAENPNLDFGKIERAVKTFREIYDTLFERMNQVRVENGYEPVNYRKGYFPHFEETAADNVLAQFGRALGIDTDVQTLPTTINGLTHSFRPGITWFANANERLGFQTAYDAVQGFDKYIEGVANVIFQTKNIQQLRALAQQIRYRASDKGIRMQVDAVWADTRLTEDEKIAKINAIYKDGRYKLSGLVNEIEEYTNLLANKKSKNDRWMEDQFGRKAYTVMKNFESRVGANMIAGNLASALTNFIPLTQAWGQVDSPTILRAMWQTLKAYKADDGFAARSSFLTNRRGSDPIVKTWQQKVSGALGTPMEYIDTFTADTIVRARYAQNMRRGMSEVEAMSEADAFTSRVMADRSKGSMPTLFGSVNPIFKAITQFQLEVNNQFSDVFKDLPRAYKDKGLAALAAALLKYFFGAWLFNELYEFLIGRRPALDPIGLLNDTVGDYTGYALPNVIEMGVGAIQGEKPDFRREKAGAFQSTMNIGKNTLEQLPFASGASVALGAIGYDIDAGRIPVSAAVPDVSALLKAATSENWSGKKRWNEAQKELNKLAYFIPPFGGNQAQKAYKGIQALIKGGSYSMDANGEEKLQYPVYNDGGFETATDAARIIAFGKSSLPQARQWAEDGYQSFSAKQTKAYKQMQQAGATQKQAFELISALRGVSGATDGEKAAAQAKILKESKLPDKVKTIAYGTMIPSAAEREKVASIDERANAWEIISGRIAITEAAQQKKLTEQDKWSIAVKNTGDSITRKEALRLLMDAKQFEKLEMAEGYDIKPYGYVSVAKKLKEISPDGSYSSAEIRQAIEDVCGPLQAYPAIEEGRLDFVKYDKKRRAALWQIFSTATSAKNNPYDEETGNKVLQEKTALKSKTEE